MTGAYFRAGVGGVIVDESRRILVLRRKGAAAGGWQLPQGGIEIGETPGEALHREMKEEVGLSPHQLEILSTTRDWLVYELPPEYRNEKVGWGQVQRWYLCRLVAASEAVRPDEVEFSEAKWVSAAELVKGAVAFRVPVYERLVAEFGL